jgi:hypothetical protein
MFVGFCGWISSTQRLKFADSLNKVYEHGGIQVIEPSFMTPHVSSLLKVMRIMLIGAA